MNRPSPDAAVLSERVARPAIHETTWSDDQQMVPWHMLKYIDQGNWELADRVRVLESSICRCGDCVMHRDKARHGAKARAQECGSYWYQNEPISSASTVPPEPAAPSCIGLFCARFNNMDPCCRERAPEPAAPSAEEPLCSHLQHIMAEPAAPVQDDTASLDALKAEASDSDGALWIALHKWIRAANGSPKLVLANEIDAVVRELTDRAYALGRDEAQTAIVEARKAVE